MLDAQLDAYMKGKAAAGSDEDGAGGGHPKRKRPPAKERLGPRAEMDVKVGLDDRTILS